LRPQRATTAAAGATPQRPRAGRRLSSRRGSLPPSSRARRLVSGAHPGAPNRQAAAIGRGEALFNGRTFAIDDVRGINSADPDDGDPVTGTFIGSCGTCHDTPNIGNHSVSLPIDIGITTASPVGGLDVENLPTYAFEQIGTGKTIQVTDPGRGLVSGKFKDIGKTKGPTLRARHPRPYFHNGAAKNLGGGRFLRCPVQHRLRRGKADLVVPDAL
jgi:hypothetical protein